MQAFAHSMCLEPQDCPAALGWPDKLRNMMSSTEDTNLKKLKRECMEADYTTSSANFFTRKSSTGKWKKTPKVRTHSIEALNEFTVLSTA